MSASRSSVAHNYFRSSLRILFTAFLETKTQLWKFMSAISACCIGSSGSPLHPPLITAFKRNKNLKEIMGGTRIENGKVKKFSITSRTGKCTPFLSGARTLCCNQVLTTNTFMSQQTMRTFNIFVNLNCKSEYVIYLMECILCKMQYVGKADTAVNPRLNNYRKDTKKPNSILACKHFQEQGHNFNKHAKFVIIDKLVNLHGSKKALREMLVIR